MRCSLWVHCEEFFQGDRDGSIRKDLLWSLLVLAGQPGMNRPALPKVGHLKIPGPAERRLLARQFFGIEPSYWPCSWGEEAPGFSRRWRIYAIVWCREPAVDIRVGSGACFLRRRPAKSWNSRPTAVACEGAVSFFPLHKGGWPLGGEGSCGHPEQYAGGSWQRQRPDGERGVGHAAGTGAVAWSSLLQNPNESGARSLEDDWPGLAFEALRAGDCRKWFPGQWSAKCRDYLLKIVRVAPLTSIWRSSSFSP